MNKPNKMAGHINLGKDAQKAFDFSIACYQKGLCTATELVYALHDIHQDEVNRQCKFLVEQGFKATGAFNHVYNLDEGSEVL